MSPSFLKALARARPDPGGGAAAAHGAAIGVALLEKVVQLEGQRPEAKGGVGSVWSELLTRVRQLAAALARLQEEDVWAYFNLARTRTCGNPGEIAMALEEAVGCPLRIMQQAQEGLGLISQAGARCKLHLRSDLLVACELLSAAFRGAHHIARANLPLMGQNSRRTIWEDDLEHTLQAAEAMWRQVRAELSGTPPCPR
jgi:formiminotetrahydrofolate cyclodeaminase